MSDEFSDAVHTKARRYVADGRVMQDAEHELVWWVNGADPDRPYRVQVALGGPLEVAAVSCTCTHGQNNAGRARCAHALAALAGLAAQRRGKG